MTTLEEFQAFDERDIVSPPLSQRSERHQVQDGGWDNFSFGDLKALVYGNHHQIGYLERSKAISLKKLGLELPKSSLPLVDAGQWLADFEEARRSYYRSQRLLINEDGTTAYVKLPLLTRGMPAYQAKQGDFFEELRDWAIARAQPCVHLRLSPWAPEGASPLDSFISMRSIVNKFISWLQAQLDYRPKYVWVIEPTKRGHCHIHFLFFGMEFLIRKEKIDSWWAKQGLGNEAGVWVEGVVDPERMLGYMIKYLLKETGSLGSKEWMGMLTLARRREFGVSNDLRRSVNRWMANQKRKEYNQSLEGGGLTSIGLTNSKKFSAVGIYDIALLEAFLSDKSGPGPPVDALRENLGQIMALARSEWRGTRVRKEVKL